MYLYIQNYILFLEYGISKILSIKSPITMKCIGKISSPGKLSLTNKQSIQKKNRKNRKKNDIYY